MSCSDAQGPVIASQLIGVGVRISVYVQATLLPVLCVRTTLVDDISNALYSVISFAYALGITALYLAFKQQPSISLQDALVATYLLGILWTSVFLSTGFYVRYIHRDKVPEILFVALGFFASAYGIAVFARAATLGNTPECNSEAVIVLMRPIPVLENNKGRILGLVAISAVLVVHSILLTLDYRIFERLRGALNRRSPSRDVMHSEKVDTETPRSPHRHRHYAVSERTSKEQAEGSQANASGIRGQESHHSKPHHTFKVMYDMSLNGHEICVFIIVMVLMLLFVVNTELMIKWNRFQDNSFSLDLGQILSLVLLLPLLSRTVQNLLPGIFDPRSARRKQRRGSRGYNGRHTERRGSGIESNMSQSTLVL